MVTTKNSQTKVAKYTKSSQYNYETTTRGELYTSPLAFCNGWVLVSYGGQKGWIAPEYICTNETSNCN